MKQLRLDKYLSDMSVETRSRLKQMIRYGHGVGKRRSGAEAGDEGDARRGYCDSPG